MQADMKLSLFLPAAQAHPLQVIDIVPGQDAAAVWGAACRRSESRMDYATPLLLLPEGYSMLPGDTVQQASHASHLHCLSILSSCPNSSPKLQTTTGSKGGSICAQGFQWVCCACLVLCFASHACCRRIQGLS